MIVTLNSRFTSRIDDKLNELRKHYQVEVLGFSVSGTNVSCMVDITMMHTWDEDEGEEPFDLPDDPAIFKTRL